MDKKSEISKMASSLGKLSHQKSPRSKEHYAAMGKKGALKRWGNKDGDKKVEV